MSRWFRMYDDLLDDPKVQRLDPVLFKTWVNLLCLASRNGGELPRIDDIAFALRVTADVAESRMLDLVEKGLIDQGEKVTPHNWDRRQFLSDSSTERSRKSRATVKATGVQQDCNVASAVAATPPETETETDISNHHTRGPDGWNQLEAKCREAAGWQNEPHPNLFVIGPIAALIEAGCILELDVLPTIRARSSACRGVKNWKYFISAIQQARDDRLGALTPANPSKPFEARHGNTAKRNTIADGFAIIDAAIAAEEQRLGQLGTTEISPSMGGQGLKLVS